MWQVTFTHVGALWLAAAAVLPVIIHLLSRQRPRVVRFPAVRFIRLSQRRSFHRTRLRHLLLLLLRMMLIAVFAALIARPVLRRGAGAAEPGGPEGTPAAVIVVDDSLSMSYRAGDATWFEAARSGALELARSLPAGVPAAVITTSHPRGKLMLEREAVADRVAALRAGTRANACWSALEKAGEMLHHEGASRRDVFLFTDMTESAWAGHQRRTAQVGPDVNVHIVDCAPRGGANGAVQELRQEGEPAILGAVLRLEARVLASAGPLKRTVQFELDGAALERHALDLAADEEASFTFRALLGKSGHHWGRVAFLNPDALPEDDARTFTVEVVPEVGVLCVEDDPEAALESASYFLRLALNPWEEPGRGVFRVERTSPAGLEELSLGPYDVVVLAGARRMSEAAWNRLDAYVSGGGGLLAFLGPEAEDAYRTPAARAVLPAQVGAEVAAPADAPFGLRIVSTGHPFVTALLESGASLAQVRFDRCRRVVPAPDAVELLSLGPDLPALVVSEMGGRTAVFAATADDSWGWFARTEPFTPFCHELLFFLAGRSPGSIRSVPVGTQVPITFETSSWPTIVYVTAPGAREPERLLPGTTPGRHTYWKTDRPGYYRVDLEQHDRKWRTGFAVNTAPIESRMGKVEFEEIKEAIRAGSVRLAAEASFGADAAGGEGGLRELTPYAALLALALLVAECFLANRFYVGERASTPG
ncbi:MAG: hypothetical protein AMK73_03950 [Planctomycetes bacterium SM23_32]|nr:MAG: hypothetical protein AMK73_03950 [Planctomycetes bacterium SM23_32]